ncbi:hypothetical protein HUU42_13490, partial [bacterium]|nr:hypothetical protein [bacterium]
MYKRFNAANVLLSGIAFLLFGSSLLTAGSVPVTNTNDTGAGSLRSAISAAAPGDTVVFNAGLAGQTILLTSGELTINQNLTIIGLGAANLTISGNSASRIFFITGGVTVNITKLMIRDGFATGFTHGGGIHNEFSTVNLDSCILFSNLADISDYGGGIYTSGDMTIMRSIIDSNEADYGGGIYNDGGIVTVQQSAVIHNLARLDGGGFYNFNDNTINLYASTLSHNYAAGSGGGFYNTSTGNVQSSTITQNRANSVNGGGVFNSGAMTMLNTIVAGNISVAAPDYQGPVTSSGYNLIGVSAGSTGFGTTGDILDQPAGIGLLQNNGGFAPTHALLPGSIAIDAGNDFIGADQRGFPRPFDDPNYSNIDDGNDIGAFESQTPLPPDPLLVLNTNNSGFGSLRDAISFANSNAGPDTVRFAAVLSGDSIAIASVLNLTDDSTMVDADINGDSIPDIILQPSSSG